MKWFIAILIPAVLLCATSLDLDEDEGRIARGREANENEFPWMVYIKLDDEFSCTGFLISNSYLLTAAHCMMNRSISDMSAVIGNVNREQQMVEFERHIMHPNYDPRRIKSDLSLMQLKTPVTFTDSIKPICLGKEKSFFNPGNNVLQMGWGRDRNDTIVQPKNLKVTDVGRLISHDECRLAVADQIPCIQLDGRLCVQNSNGEGVCEGDSGSPIVYNNGNDYVAIGLISFGFYANCTVNNTYPEITTDLSYFSDWIVNTVDEPVCIME